MLFAFIITGRCFGDALIIAPTPGAVGGPTDTATPIPFLTRMITVAPFHSMRYQQVYNASLFTNVDSSLIYISTFTFYLDDFGSGSFAWTITNMQVNLSTTQRAADQLSTNFIENVGADDTVVFGPARHDFPDGPPHNRLPILFDRPFRYDPSSGNLLLDIRIYNGDGPLDMNVPQLNAYNSPSDESSRIWATNVEATAADRVDTTGLDTVIQFSGVPRLQVHQTIEQGTNFVVVKWPAQPSAFLLESTGALGAGTRWHTITNYDRAPSTNTYGAPLSSLGDAGYYRLTWESGQPLEPAAFPLSPAKPQEQLQAH